MEYAVEIGVRCHDIHTEFLKGWFRYSNVDMEGIHRYTDSMVTA
jgi:hypothetical protein